MQRGSCDWSALDLNRPARLIASELGCSPVTVRYHQKRQGILGHQERREKMPLPDLTGGRVMLLGAMPDEDVAAVWGCNRSGIKSARLRLGIPAWEPDPDNPKPRISVRGQPQHFRPCVHCGAWFPTSPSSKSVTCSRRCLSAHRRLCLRLRAQGWSDEARQRLRSKGRPEALRNGSAEARRLALANPAEFHEAKIWEVITPTGQHRRIINLRRTLINELGQPEGVRVSGLLKTMNKAMCNGQAAWVTRCGWSLASPSKTKSPGW